MTHGLDTSLMAAAAKDTYADVCFGFRDAMYSANFGNSSQPSAAGSSGKSPTTTC